jgi:hypothetical protein
VAKPKKPNRKRPKPPKTEARRAALAAARHRKRHETRWSRPSHHSSSSESGDAEPNLKLITGEESDIAIDSKVPRTDSVETKSPAPSVSDMPSPSESTPKESAPAERATADRTASEAHRSPESCSDQIEYDESDDEVKTPSSPQLTEQQRAIHPGSPATPRTKAAVERAKRTDADLVTDPPPMLKTAPRTPHPRCPTRRRS